ADILVPAEQQRLGFARLLLHRPAWILIEEATDALDPAAEEAMIRLIDQEFPDCAVITIGYHATLDLYHRRKWLLAAGADGRVTARAI
ncbi:hypothetical protein ABTN19_19380, partial [Acinetobacter baumannii]